MPDSDNRYLFKDAPWTLRGSGLFLISHYDSVRVSNYKNLPKWLEGRVLGGLGGFAALSYESTPFGPFAEIAQLSGKIKAPQGSRYTAMDSYCNSNLVHIDSERIWGLEKKLAQIKLIREDKLWKAEAQSTEGEEFLDLRVREAGPQIPFTTGVFPISLMQQMGKRRFYLALRVRGKFRFGKIERFKVNSNYLLDNSDRKQLALVIHDLKITYPEPIQETTIEHFKYRLAEQL